MKIICSRFKRWLHELEIRTFPMGVHDWQETGPVPFCYMIVIRFNIYTPLSLCLWHLNLQIIKMLGFLTLHFFSTS